MKFKSVKVKQRSAKGVARDVERGFKARQQSGDGSGDSSGGSSGSSGGSGGSAGSPGGAGLDYEFLRAQVRSKLFDCMESVLLGELCVSKETFAMYTGKAEFMLKQYALVCRDASKVMADKWLESALNGVYVVTFMLPVVKLPKRGRERAELEFVRGEARLWAKAFCYAFSRERRLAESFCYTTDAAGLPNAVVDGIFRAVAREYRERASL